MVSVSHFKKVSMVLADIARYSEIISLGPTWLDTYNIKGSGDKNFWVLVSHNRD